jgi:hypothetical protein
MKIIESLQSIVDSEGTIIVDAGNRNGRRYENSGVGSGGPGRQYNREKHISNSYSTFLHADCEKSASIVFENTSMKFEGVLLLEPIPSRPL